MELQSALKCTLLTALLGALGVVSGSAQYTFTSGSDGSYGPLNILTNTTLVMPSDGIFRCTSIYVATNATLKFTPNALNTPVYLLATNNITINGTIDVSGFANNGSQGGLGGPGGFAGGNGAYSSLAASDGHGPGAGTCNPSLGSYGIGSASYATTPNNVQATTNNGVTYGSALLIPLVGGSGGSGSPTGYGGSGGGGAILIGSNTRIDANGSVISSNPNFNPGGYANYGCGSGGAIRLIAPVMTGAGLLSVASGYNTYWGIWGASGRIRIDCMDRRSLALTLNPSSVATIGANMLVFPTNNSHLDITQVAGTNITVGTSAPVFFTLPQDSSTNQTVIVQASNFGAVVPIRVALTPDNGSSSSYITNIDNTVNNPASVTVPVVVPVNVQVQVNAWTR